MAENFRLAQQQLPVPLALEHIAALVEWPEAEMDEAAFLTEILERTGALLLLDVANLYANARNHHYDPFVFLDRVPLDRIAYVHVAGGTERYGVYHDTHAQPGCPGGLGAARRVVRADMAAGCSAGTRRRLRTGRGDRS